LKKSAILSFTCLEAIQKTGATLTYVLGGTNKASYTLSSTSVTVTLKDATKKLTNPTITLTKVATSTASKTKVTASCPTIGYVYVWFAPKGTTAPANTVDTVKAAFKKYMGETEAATYNASVTYKSA
jgi:hypothetical protein